jgi:UDP-N-acetylglucosamine 1-carboxyvinyltransferase
VEYEIIPDRLEAGALLIAGAVTAGDIYIPNISHTLLDVPLLKLQEMGHTIIYTHHTPGIRIIGTKYPKATSFKTGPYPNFPTDLQAPMMAALVCAHGESIVEETVYENRLQHTHPLTQLGAQIDIVHTNKAKINGVMQLNGTQVTAHDIRAVCSLVLAGLVAQGNTTVDGVYHWQRGFEGLEQKLNSVGGNVLIDVEASKE